MTKRFILALVLAVLCQGCDRSTQPLPEIKKLPTATVARIPKPEFTVLEQEMSGLEAMFVVATPDAPKTTREALLQIADYLAQDREAVVQTLVLFRDPRKPVPSRKLGRDEQFGHSFAVATIHPIAHIREVRTGVFN